jgi:DNA polymerase-3 subunit delta
LSPRAAAEPGVHVILGTDSFLAEEALERLLTAAVGQDRTDAVETFRGDETSWSRILDAARSRSLFAARRAVVVRGADAIKGSDEDLAGYLEDPTPGVALVLLATKPDKRRTAWKRLLDRAAVVSAEPLKARALRGFVDQRLRERGLSLPEEGIGELLERVGQDLRRLMGEIDKLEAFAQGKRTLSAEEVAEVLGRGIAQPLWKLADAFLARRTVAVVERMEEVLDEGESGLMVLGTMARSLRQIRAAKALGGKRLAPSEAAPKLGVPPFKVGEVLDAARQWSLEDVRSALSALVQADRGLKLGGEPRALLLAAIANACGRKREAPPGRTSARPGA